jgi:hypothetical protein
MKMDIEIQRPEPIPRPEPRIVIYRYGKEQHYHNCSTTDYWSLNVEDAEEMLEKLAAALNDARREQ